MSTIGERCADDVRCYLTTNGLKQSQLTGATLAELIDRRVKHEAIHAKKKKRLATEEEWLRELEKEPHLQGVNVRKELAALQFWCKERGVLATRKRFVNWLNKSATNVVVTPGGAVPPAQRKAEEAPKGWLAKLNELFPDSTVARGGLFEIKEETDYQWSRLDPAIREAIRRAL